MKVSLTVKEVITQLEKVIPFKEKSLEVQTKKVEGLRYKVDSEKAYIDTIEEDIHSYKSRGLIEKFITYKEHSNPKKFLGITYGYTTSTEKSFDFVGLEEYLSEKYERTFIIRTYPHYAYGYTKMSAIGGFKGELLLVFVEDILKDTHLYRDEFILYELKKEYKLLSKLKNKMYLLKSDYGWAKEVILSDEEMELLGYGG